MIPCNVCNILNHYSLKNRCFSIISPLIHEVVLIFSGFQHTRLSFNSLLPADTFLKKETITTVFRVDKLSIFFNYTPTPMPMPPQDLKTFPYLVWCPISRQTTEITFNPKANSQQEIQDNLLNSSAGNGENCGRATHKRQLQRRWKISFLTL